MIIVSSFNWCIDIEKKKKNDIFEWYIEIDQLNWTSSKILILFWYSIVLVCKLFFDFENKFILFCIVSMFGHYLQSISIVFVCLSFNSVLKKCSFFGNKFFFTFSHNVHTLFQSYSDDNSINNYGCYIK